jgi:hypothetical protein
LWIPELQIRERHQGAPQEFPREVQPVVEHEEDGVPFSQSVKNLLDKNDIVQADENQIGHQ